MSSSGNVTNSDGDEPAAEEEAAAAARVSKQLSIVKFMAVKKPPSLCWRWAIIFLSRLKSLLSAQKAVVKERARPKAHDTATCPS